VDTVRTVSDTKRDFYSHHTRPINSVYRRFVEELLVEMHLLSVNLDFRYDPIYALGVFASFERFMMGYRPEADSESIFNGLCQSVGSNPNQYRQDAREMLHQAKEMSVAGLIESLQSPTGANSRLVDILRGIAQNSRFKYSRLFAIGLYAILAEAEPEPLKTLETRNQILQQLSEALNLPAEKLQKDLDLYRTNLDKMDQLLTVIEEALEADRKKRETAEPAVTQSGSEAEGN
jgi:photosystem II biogenesis protein Psp29